MKRYFGIEDPDDAPHAVRVLCQKKKLLTNVHHVQSKFLTICNMKFLTAVAAAPEFRPIMLITFQS
jgi:hypothetical protein